MVINETGIETRQENRRSMSNWLGVFAVKEAEEHFFLMVDNCAGYVVPKRAFADTAKLEEFRALLAAHVMPPA